MNSCSKSICVRGFYHARTTPFNKKSAVSIHASKPQPYIYGFRGRMDERYDMVRSVRNQRYVYIRNYMRHRPYGQYLEYMFKTPTTQV